MNYRDIENAIFDEISTGLSTEDCTVSDITESILCTLAAHGIDVKRICEGHADILPYGGVADLALQALADIGYADDMTCAARKKKAQRVYFELRGQFDKDAAPPTPFPSSGPTGLRQSGAPASPKRGDD